MFKVEPLGRRHNRAAFTCESAAQTSYFRQTARQHDESGMSAIFVMSETQTGRIAGYYALSMHDIEAGEIPPDLRKKYKLPRSGALPAALIGRLARDLQFKGQGIGPLLAYDALKRVRDARAHVGCIAVVVDPDGTEARKFWREKLGFQELPGRNRLFYPAGMMQRLP